jgi:hypothetical protein
VRRCFGDIVKLSFFFKAHIQANVIKLLAAVRKELLFTIDQNVLLMIFFENTPTLQLSPIKINWKVFIQKILKAPGLILLCLGWEE